MEREVITEGPSVEEAIDDALEQLGVQQDAVEYEVLEEPGRKILGVGSGKPARVRVWLKESFLSEVEAERRLSDEVTETSDIEKADSAEEGSTYGGHTVEEVDAVADQAASSIHEVLAGFGIEAEIEEYEGDEGEVILDIAGDDLGVLIGRHGKTLDAFQVLVSAITNKKAGFRYPVLVDVSGYRYRRKAKLEEIAYRAAERVGRQGRAVALRPMSSYERRLVHIALRDDRRVTTASEGEEPFRHVVVLPR